MARVQDLGLCLDEPRAYFDDAPFDEDEDGGPLVFDAMVCDPPYGKREKIDDNADWLPALLSLAEVSLRSRGANFVKHASPKRGSLNFLRICFELVKRPHERRCATRSCGCDPAGASRSGSRRHETPRPPSPKASSCRRRSRSARARPARDHADRISFPQGLLSFSSSRSTFARAFSARRHRSCAQKIAGDWSRSLIVLERLAVSPPTQHDDDDEGAPSVAAVAAASDAGSATTPEHLKLAEHWREMSAAARRAAAQLALEGTA